ncbi:hypothetical protein GGI12_001808 [Dipsacomyces acuminosporus]|nr:hypothetical protein GGI12_001808 [Dipsacomyces acuminosporus]
MVDGNGRQLLEDQQGKPQQRQAPFKYDIRVTGDLFVDENDNATTTKVSVKIRGNQDGDVVVEQDDARSLASPTPSISGDTRRPQFTQKHGLDGGLQLHIHALPLKPKASVPLQTISGGGVSGGTSVPARLELEAPSRLKAASSFGGLQSSRTNTRMSEYSRARALSTDPSIVEITPAFEDPADDSASIFQRDVTTPQSIEISASPVLVGGGGRPNIRPRSSTFTTMEDKCTMTTFRGLPDELRTASSSRTSIAHVIDPDMAFALPSCIESPTPSVLRGGGAAVVGIRRSDTDPSVFNAFNGPLVAPPESRVHSRDGSRPRRQLKARPSSADKINYRERAEGLLTQYYPPEILKKYLDELRSKYRFMGPGGMSSSEIAKLLENTTADSQLKEQLRASLEEIVRVPSPQELSESDHMTVQSQSHPQYLSLRETELRDVLDRTSVSPTTKSVRSAAPSSILVGGGMSMDNLDSPESSPARTRPFETMRSDQLSVAASVKPIESVNGSNRGSPAIKPLSKPPTPAPPAVSSPSPVPSTALVLRSSTPLAQPEPEKQPEPQQQQQQQPEAQPEPHAEAELETEPEPQPQPQPEPQQKQQQKQQQSQASGTQQRSGPQPGPGKAGPGYWEDNDKFKMMPPDMSRAFTILKSQPIVMREMRSADISFTSPFARQHKAPSPNPSVGAASRHSGAGRRGSSTFSERHPAEAKVAKAVSELEEVLRRTEAATKAEIEENFQAPRSSVGGSSPAPSSRYSFRNQAEDRINDAASTASRESLVGGGASPTASSRSASISTRVSALAAKLPSLRADSSASKYTPAQSTVRTETLFKKGMEYDDAGSTKSEEENEEEEAVVPIDASMPTGSAISLPMQLDDMPPELASVIRRTGGLDNSKLRRTETPSSDHASSRRCAGASPDPADEASSVAGSERTANSARSSARPPAAQSDAGNKSLTELDIVMGRTGGLTNKSVASSRVSSPSAASVLRGGSGGSVVPNSSEDELATVLRRTSGYVPSNSSYAPSAASNRRPESAFSEAKSSSSSEAADRPVSGASSLRPSYGYSGIKERAPSSSSLHTLASPQQPRSSAPSPARSAARSPVASSAYAPSPLRGPVYQPAPGSPNPSYRGVRASLDARDQPQAPPSEYQPSEYGDDAQPQAARSPSPEIPRAPTPVFGRFPSPPPYIKNRGKTQGQEEDENAGAPAGMPPPASSPVPSQRSQQQQVPRGRPHSQSVCQSPAPSRPYDEPVVDRLDLETGSLASRRSRPRQGSEFGSASTLMTDDMRENFQLPKVVEEDVDSLASYPSSRQAASPNLVGGGRTYPGQQDPSQSTLRGGGAIHPAFASNDSEDAIPVPVSAAGAHGHMPASHSCANGCCGVCGQGVGRDDVVVRPQVMHASCLRCEACDCLLTSSTFRAVEGHVYCEAHYQKYFPGVKSSIADMAGPNAQAAAVHPGFSDKKYMDMNRIIMESFTSVDDFLLHMRQMQKANSQKSQDTPATYSGDPSKVERAGDIDVDRQTHYEREQVTSPSGTPYIMERVVDKKTKTKVLEKRYPANGAALPAEASSAEEPTLVGGGAIRSKAQSSASRLDALRSTNHSSASRPESSLLNDTTTVNGWEHPLCPVCTRVVYQNDRVTHEGYGYHKTCMRCRQCSLVVPPSTAVRIKGVIYCKKHGGELMRRRSILMRKKSTMGRRSRHPRNRSVVSTDRFTDDGHAAQAPPMPDMPMFSADANASDLPAIPAIGQEQEQQHPRRVTTALRNFLQAAAEQIENQSLLPVTPEPLARPTPPSVRTQSSSPSAIASNLRARYPVPPPKKTSSAKSQASYIPMPKVQPAATPPSSPPSVHGSRQRPASRSIFSGSKDSVYDANVVNALRQEAQRQINSSQANMALTPGASDPSKSPRLLTPRGPSIADALQKYASGRNGRVSVSSHFDPFLEGSQDQINNNYPPQQPAFSPNAQLDNLERRFRNANFRPPWAIKPQSSFN